LAYLEDPTDEDNLAVPVNEPSKKKQKVEKKEQEEVVRSSTRISEKAEKN